VILISNAFQVEPSSAFVAHGLFYLFTFKTKNKINPCSSNSTEDKLILKALYIKQLKTKTKDLYSFIIYF
jgi:hypothetical protein